MAEIKGRRGAPERTDFSLYEANFSDGIENLFSPAIRSKSGLRYSVNMRSGKDLGVLEKRPGTELLNAQITATKDITGLYQFKPYSTAAWKKLAAIDGSTGTIYYDNSGTWAASTFTTIPTGSKVEFIYFRDRVQAWGGFSPKSSSNGVAWDATDLTSAPSGYFPQVYNGRVYVKDGTNKNRVYYSPLQIDTQTWNTAEDFSAVPNSREITALRAAPRGNALIVFTDENFYYGTFTDSNIGLELTPVADHGVLSHRAVVPYGNALYWIDQNGDIIRYVPGEYPEVIGRGIDKVGPRGIAEGSLDDISGAKKAKMIVWSVGTITIDEYGADDTSLANALIVFNPLDRAFWTDSLPTTPTIVTTMRAAGEREKLYYGDTNGKVFELDKAGVYSDDGAAFACEAVSQWHYGEQADHFHKRKYLEALYVELLGSPVTFQMKFDHTGWGQHESTTHRFEAVLTPSPNTNVVKVSLPHDIPFVRLKVKFSDHSANKQVGIVRYIVYYRVADDIEEVFI